MRDLHKNAFRLAGRLIFKSHLLALNMENNFKLFRLNWHISNDLRDWGYYKNLSGEPHELNKAIGYMSPITGDNVLLTKAYLDTNEDLKQYILDSGELEELIKLYPGDVTYIMGMFYPVDIDTVINAKEGTVLSYDKELVADYEGDLTIVLETFIKDMLRIISIPGYIETDELYGQSLMLYMLQAITLRVIEYKYYNTNTHRVDDALLDNKLSSVLSIGGLVTNLPRSIKLYLYKNIDFLANNAGKNSTIDILIKNVLTPLRISCSEINLKPMNYRMTGKNSNHSKEVKDRSTIFIKDRHTNKSYGSSYGVIYEHELSDEDVSLSKIGTKYRTEKYLNLDKGYSEIGKHLFLQQDNDDILLFQSRERLLVESTLYILYNHKDRLFDLEYKSTNFKFKGSTLLLSILYYLQKLTNRDDPIDSLTFNGLYFRKDVDAVIANLYPNDASEEYFRLMANDVNSIIEKNPDELETLKDFTGYVGNALYATSRLYGYTTFVGNMLYSCNIDLLDKRLREPFTIDIADIITKDTIEDTLVSLNVGLDDDETEIILAIVKAIIGYSLSPTDDQDKLLKTMATLMDRLTSYTVNTLYTGTDVKILATKDTVDTFNGMTLAYLTDVDYKCGGVLAEFVSDGDDSKGGITEIDSNSMLIENTKDTTIGYFAVSEIAMPISVGMKTIITIE